MKYLILLLTIPTIVNAAENTWIEYEVPYNYILSNDLAKRRCGYLPKLIKEVKEKNNLTDVDKIRIGDKILLPSCKKTDVLYISQSEAYPLQEKPRPEGNSSNIIQWEKQTVAKGYMLSKDLVYQKNCNLNWTKQLAEFKVKNPKIKNPNVIMPNKEIWVQTCKDNEATKDLVAQNPEILTYLIGTDFRFDFYGGVSYIEKLAHLAGVGIRGNVMDAAGFELKVHNFSSNMLLLGEFEYKDPENFKKQYNLTLGIMSYMVTDNQGGLTDSGSVYATYGYIFRPSAITVFEVEAGVNLASRFGFIASMSGMKKVGDVWAGLFLESRSLTTSQKKAGNLILSGLKLSF